MNKLSNQEILALPMGQNDAGAATVREYLVALILAVWEEGEGFSGKRPFGNSGWERELLGALAKAGVIKSKITQEYGLEDIEISTSEERRGRKIIEQAIEALGAGDV